ncbi:MAG: type II secretion system protein GspC [bacterium]
MVKKVFWIVILLLATISAYLAADAVTVRLKTILDVPPTTPFTVRPEEHESPKSRNRKGYYQIITQRDLLQVEPSKEGPQRSEEEEEKVAPLTALRLKLLGTMTGYGIVPFAIILDETTRKQDLFTEGDEIGPAKLVKIYRHKVILEHEGKEEMLIAFEDMEALISAALDQSTEPGAQESPGETAIPGRIGKKIGQNHWVMERDEVQNVLENSSQLLTQVRIIPHFTKGKIDQPDGFQVANIRPRSFFDTMGLRNGDVIRSVNQIPVDNAEKAFEAYQKLRNESRIEVVVLRNNKEVTLQYDINE